MIKCQMSLHISSAFDWLSKNSFVLFFCIIAMSLIIYSKCYVTFCCVFYYCQIDVPHNTVILICIVCYVSYWGLYSAVVSLVFSRVSHYGWKRVKALVAATQTCASSVALEMLWNKRAKWSMPNLTSWLADSVVDKDPWRWAREAFCIVFMW